MNLFKRQLLKCGQTVAIRKRTLSSNTYESSSPVVNLSTIETPTAIVKTTESVRGGDKFFSRVGIVPDATHVFCVLYTDTLSVVERDNYMVTINGKNMRVLAVTNIDEKNEVLAIQATDRGDSTKEATKA